MVSKFTMKEDHKDVAQYLNDFQFRVGLLSGGDAISQSVNTLLRKRHRNGVLTMLMIYFLKSFNMVDQSTLLHKVEVIYQSIS